jgi:MFS family permease
MFTNLFQSLVIIAYALTANTSYFVVYAIVLIYSAINQFYVPAEFATLPYVIPKKLLPEANGLFLITQQGSLIFGFGIAGFFLNLFGFQYTLIICSLFLLLAFISTLFLPRMVPRRKIPTKFDKAVIAYFENIYSGYIFIKENKFVLAPFIILVCMQVTLAVITVNAPVLTLEILKIPMSLAGVLLVVPAGIGAILGSLIIPRLMSKGVRKIRIIKYALTILALSLFLNVFIFSIFSEVIRILLSLSILIISGFSYIGILIPTQTFLQQKTPFGLRGRVFGNYWFLVTVISILPVIVSGTITEIFGIKVLMAILIIGILGLYWFLRIKEKKYLLPEGYI